MNNFFAQFFRSAKRQPLPFKPLATINAPNEAAKPAAPRRRTPSLSRANGFNRNSRHTNQLSS